MSKKIKNIIKDSLKSKKKITENRIDSIIKEYIFERPSYLSNDNQKVNFSKKSTETLEEIVSNLNDIVEDLETIKEKESDTILFESRYADDLLEGHIKDIKKKINSLQEIVNFTKNNISKEDLNNF
jgi:hypothetical protein